MARKKQQKKDAVNFWFLATLVVTVTVGAMAWIGSKDEKQASEQVQQADDEVLEVQPLIPTGKITDASWNVKKATGVDDVDTGKSMLDGNLDPFQDEELARKKADSLRKTIDKIHGLGVYVAPAKEDDD